MPIIRVIWPSGQGANVQKAVAADITESVVKNVGVPPTNVYVIFEIVDHSNFAVGGQLASERIGKS